MSRPHCVKCGAFEGHATDSCPRAPLSPIALDFTAAMAETPIGGRSRYAVEFEANLNAQLRAIVARVAQEEREKGERYVVEAVEWSHPSNDIPEGSTRITIKGVIQPVGAGDTIRYLRGTP